MKTAIITADDFGVDISVNDAVEQAHRHGCLTAASLMVTGNAVDDAVARARTMPELGVGLHLVLVEGRPALPASQLPDLTGPDGLFRSDMTRMAIDMFLRPSVRRQLEAEITAQFERFAATGLPLDHVNAHKHFHLHPTIADAVLRIGRRFGLKASRAPVEPAAIIDAIEPAPRDLATRVADRWARRLQQRFRRAGVTMADQVFGLGWSGAMTAERFAALIDRLPDGMSEIYFHPATADAYPGSAPGYRYREELAALTAPAVLAALDRHAIRRTRLGQL